MLTSERVSPKAHPGFTLRGCDPIAPVLERFKASRSAPVLGLNKTRIHSFITFGLGRHAKACLQKKKNTRYHGTLAILEVRCASGDTFLVLNAWDTIPKNPIKKNNPPVPVGVEPNRNYRPTITGVSLSFYPGYFSRCPFYPGLPPDNPELSQPTGWFFHDLGI